MDCMKKTLIGGFLSIIGSSWSIAIMFVAGNNLVTTWYTELGRFWSTVIEMQLMFPFVLSVALTVLGIILMAVELFRKEK